MRAKREDEREEIIRSMLWLHEKAMRVGETDGGDVDGWGDRGHSTEWELKNTVSRCASIWVFRLDSGLS